MWRDAEESSQNSDRYMAKFHTNGTMGAAVLKIARSVCGAGAEHVVEEAVLLKGGSTAQAYHADDDKNLKCFLRRIGEDGSLIYHLSVLVALERDMVVMDFRGKEVEIPRYGAAVWRGDTSHAGGAHEGDCLRAYFHVVHASSERNAKDKDIGGVYARYGPTNTLEMEDVQRVVTRPEYKHLRTCIDRGRRGGEAQVDVLPGGVRAALPRIREREPGLVGEGTQDDRGARARARVCAHGRG